MIVIQLTESEQRILKELVFSNVFTLICRNKNTEKYDYLIDALISIFDKLGVVEN